MKKILIKIVLLSFAIFISTTIFAQPQSCSPAPSDITSGVLGEPQSITIPTTKNNVYSGNRPVPTYKEMFGVNVNRGNEAQFPSMENLGDIFSHARVFQYMNKDYWDDNIGEPNQSNPSSFRIYKPFQDRGRLKLIVDASGKPLERNTFVQGDKVIRFNPSTNSLQTITLTNPNTTSNPNTTYFHFINNQWEYFNVYTNFMNANWIYTRNVNNQFPEVNVTLTVVPANFPSNIQNQYIFPKQWWTEGDWGTNPTNIRIAARAYAMMFARAYAPKSSDCNSCTKVVTALEGGNEPWHYSQATYQAVLEGMIEGLEDYYGNETGNKLKFIPASFQANHLENGAAVSFPSATWKDYQGTRISEDMKCYLNGTNYHPYPSDLADTGSGFFSERLIAHPEKTSSGNSVADSKFLYLRNAWKWSEENMPAANRNIYVTEYGWDSDADCNDPNSNATGIGEDAHGLYLTRSTLMLGRLGVFRAEAYEVLDDDALGPCSFAYHSSGIWRTNGQAKNARKSLLKFMELAGGMKFNKVIAETGQGAYAFILETNGTPTHLVAWNAKNVNNQTWAQIKSSANNLTNVNFNISSGGQTYAPTTSADWHYLDDNISTSNGNITNIGKISNNSSVYNSGSGTFTLKPVPVLIPISPSTPTGCNINFTFSENTANSNLYSCNQGFKTYDLSFTSTSSHGSTEIIIEDVPGSQYLGAVVNVGTVQDIYVNGSRALRWTLSSINTGTTYNMKASFCYVPSSQGPAVATSPYDGASCNVSSSGGGPGCNLSSSSSNITIPNGGGSQSVIISGTSSTLNASSSDPAFSTSVSGNTVTVNAGTNNSSSTRNSTITVTGGGCTPVSFNVSQAGSSSCNINFTFVENTANSNLYSCNQSFKTYDLTFTSATSHGFTEMIIEDVPGSQYLGAVVNVGTVQDVYIGGSRALRWTLPSINTSTTYNMKASFCYVPSSQGPALATSPYDPASCDEPSSGGGPGCNLSSSSSSVTITNGGGSQSVTISGTSSTLNASSSNPAFSASVSGNTVTVNAGANNSSSTRSSTITVTGGGCTPVTFTVNQAGTPSCNINFTFDENNSNPGGYSCNQSRKTYGLSFTSATSHGSTDIIIEDVPSSQYLGSIVNVGTVQAIYPGGNRALKWTIPSINTSTTYTLQATFCYVPSSQGPALATSPYDPVSCDVLSNSSSNFSVPNLINFSANKKGISSEVRWVMNKDEDIDYYDVEVSTDGINFTTLATVNSFGLTSAREYKAIDMNPTIGENFYRLKIHNMNGTSYYSNTRRLNFDIDFNKIELYPNPTSDNINILMRDFAGMEGQVEIFNSLGQKMTERKYVAFPTVPVQFDVKNFTDGIYTISIKVDNQRRFTKRFVVNKL